MGSAERMTGPPDAHGPDAIQPQGWLIVCDDKAATLRRHSANLPNLFPDWKKPFIGASLREILGPDVAHGLRNALARFAGPAPPAMLPCLVLPGCEGAFDLSVHATDDENVITIERAAPEIVRSLFDRLRATLTRLAQVNDIEKLLQAATRLVSSMLPYDHAAILRIDADGKACCVAERKSHDLTSWTDGHCPIETIPPDSRAEYLAARVRVIVDGRAAPSPILAEPDAGPLDLTFTLPRAANPGEAAMLERCGFRASFAIALVVEDQLWGLMVCHDRSPQNPAMDLRAAVELFGEFLSLRLQALLQRRTIQDLASPPPLVVRSWKIMIVEDQALIAMDLEASLIERGMTVVCICASCEQALAALDGGAAIDAAILDFNLDGENAAPVADALEKRGVPFIFATGQGDGSVLPARFVGKTVTRKPYDILRIRTALDEAVNKAQQHERGQIPDA